MQLSSIVNVRLPLYSDFMKFLSHFYKILYEITIQIVRQSTILFMNSLKLSRYIMIIAQPYYKQSNVVLNS